MTEQAPEEEFVYGDYDIDDEYAAVTPASEALPYPDVEQQDDEYDPDAELAQALGFTSIEGRTPEEAVDMANNWRIRQLYFGVGQCLRVIRQTYSVPSKYPTASSSWVAADHKHFASRGTDVPRGPPVWWTGGSSGAGHVAISCGGGVCISTDWKSPGRLAYAHIDDITALWNLNFKGWTREINDVVVWMPPQTTHPTVHLSNLLPRKRNDDVLQVKKRLRAKGYTGFIVTSKYFGPGTRDAYQHYQRRLGYTGSDANGIPGETSLKKLGFTVKP